MDLYSYLQQQTEGSHYYVRQHCNGERITKLSLLFGHTGLELHIQIAIHTGQVQLAWNHDMMDQWCREAKSFSSLRTCLNARSSLQPWLDQHFQYAVLFAVRTYIASVNTHYRCVVTHEEDKPILLLPCHIENSIFQVLYHRYFLRIRLVPSRQGQHTDLHTDLHTPSGASVESLLKRGGPSYHSINNKMEVLGLMGESEIGFDIDGEESARMMDENPCDSIWSVEFMGLHEDQTVHPLESVCRVVPCHDPGSVEFQNQIGRAVLLLLPQLRSYEVKMALDAFQKTKELVHYTEDLEKMTFTVRIL